MPLHHSRSRHNETKKESNSKLNPNSTPKSRTSGRKRKITSFSVSDSSSTATILPSPKRNKRNPVTKSTSSKRASPSNKKKSSNSKNKKKSKQDSHANSLGNSSIGNEKEVKNGPSSQNISTETEQFSLVMQGEQDEETESFVHWDPNALEGIIVGYRFRLYNTETETWRPGRILNYDPISNRHYVRFYTIADEDDDTIYNDDGYTGDDDGNLDGDDEWIQLKEQIVQCGSRFVWALVRGFAWWPAQVLICKSDKDKEKEGYVFVEFFGSMQVATIKDTCEFIRPFENGKIDNVIKKHKRKRNVKAIEIACEEQSATRTARNEAILSNALKVFHAANKVAGGYLGAKIKVFRSDINYPAGSTITAYVRQYSPTMKKWLVSYDSYPPSWINFLSKEYSHKIILKPKQPTDMDIASFIFGLDDDDKNFEFLHTHCMACLQKVYKEEAGESEIHFKCRVCERLYHPACLDPPITNTRNIQKLLDSGWTCDKCTPCLGCNKFDVAFGSKQQQIPPSLALENGEKLALCSVCTPLYKKDRYCPNCGHCWDDIKYEKTQKLLKRNRTKDIDDKEIQENSDKTDLNEDIDKVKATKQNDTHESIGQFNSYFNRNITDGPIIRDPTWFRHDSTVWGFNEASMLACDSCGLWVHAGCANLTREEYELTNAGNHPVFSKEFLCRICCKKRCIEIIKALQDEDNLQLFAFPVTEDVAPTYCDSIKNPMDLETMMHRAEKQFYFNYSWTRELFELIVLNALTFNRSHSKYWNEAKRYHESCMEKIFPKLAKAAGPTKYSNPLELEYVKAKREVEMEIERTQKDENAEKKDLVGGAEVVNIKLPPLRSEPPDPVSVVPSNEIRLKPIDAHYCAWMESCLACGSSGATDTMLFCVDCGEAFHSFCVAAPIHSMSAAAAAAWRCPNCKVCEITGGLPKDETKMLYCEMCDRAFSLEMLDPPLESVPSGLWVCGQCVSCESCNNKYDANHTSLRYWSRNPRLCYSCGGCEGLTDSDRLECPVCSKLLRKNDFDSLLCQGCNQYVHKCCVTKPPKDQIQRENANMEKEFNEDSNNITFECTRCAKLKEREQITDAVHIFLKAQVDCVLWQVQAPKNDCETISSDEYSTKLLDEIHWEILNLWRDEYEKIIEAGKLMLEMLREKIGKGFEKSFLHSKELCSSEKWLNSRVARWIRFCKRMTRHETLKEGKRKKEHISIILTRAKNASSFIKLATSHLKPDLKDICINKEVMEQLLIDCDIDGIFAYPKCGLKTSENDIKCAEELYENLNLQQSSKQFSRKNTEHEIVHGKKYKITHDLVINDAESDQNSTESVEKEKTSNKKLRKPEMVKNLVTNHAHFAGELLATGMLGWNGHLANIQTEQEWRDPRICCICQTCGDDDAGVENDNDDSEMNDDDSSSVSVDLSNLPKSGRLLPVGEGFWVHTACALWSSEVWENQLGEIYELDKARSRGLKLKCFGCGRPGATLGCSKANCFFNYHYPCASICNGVLTNAKQMFCHKHTNYAKNVLNTKGIEQMRKLIIVSALKKNDLKTEGNLCSRHGSLVVHTLGKIECNHDGFHDANYVTPVGYTATRIFWSCQTIKKRTLYVLKVDSSPLGKPIISITPADNANTSFQGQCMNDVFSLFMNEVHNVNKKAFNDGDMFSFLPVRRQLKAETSFNLNAAQFFGFGLPHIRKEIENLPGIEATAVPLSPNSKTYRFCYKLPTDESIKALQRKRAGIAAEHALQNTSGSARTEGISAVARSTGSGRITRALVGNSDGEGQPNTGSKFTSALTRKAIIDDSGNDTSYQGLYRELKSVPLRDRLAAMRSHIHGWGLFTKNDVKKDGMIIEYMGEVVRQCIADKRERYYEKSGIGSCYMFRLDLNRIVDATRIGCMARFMNHSCQPNAYAKVISVIGEEGPEKKIVVFALRDIVAGEEITYDYKFPVEDGSLRCTCGAPNCIGRMN